MEVASGAFPDWRIALDIALASWYSISQLKGSSNRRRFRRASFRQHGGSSTRARHPDSRQDLARPLFAAYLTMPRVKVFYIARWRQQGGIMIDLGWLGQIAFTWEFFAAVMSIILIDLVLAGDNASC
jgi:hypothetical protein